MRRWFQTTIDKLDVFNVFQLGMQVYVITRRSVNSEGHIILEVLNLETGRAGKQHFIWPDTVVEYVVHAPQS